MQTIPLSVIINSDLITNEESYPVIGAFSQRPYLSAEEILALDLSAKGSGSHQGECMTTIVTMDEQA